ncbi:MAG: aminotransferase class IV [candidate division Zixibacteria bacterium]|nr:aminotransferase class IV [candidate division Zixibacteria bacterium]
MAKIITSINGRLVRNRDAKISVFDNSFLYAEGLFETFLAIDDRIIFAREHLQRLYRGARVIGIDIPTGTEELTAWMTKAVCACPGRVKKVRLTLTSGESVRWGGRRGKPKVIISVSTHKIPTKPFKLQVSEFNVDHKSAFRKIKTLSYAIHAAAFKQAQENGCDDALLLNRQHQVAEVTSANIYWVKKGRIYTPPMTSGCLGGVTRKIVLREAKKLDRPIIEKDCRLPEMLKAEEIFISSSLKLVIGVSDIIIGKRRHQFQPGPLTDEFSKHFRQIVRLT